MALDTAAAPFNAADPSASFLSSSCLDFLLIELVPLAHRVARLDQPPPPPQQQQQQQQQQPAGAGQGSGGDDAASTSAAGAVGTGTAPGSRRPVGDEDEEEADAVRFRLESQGYRVGQGLVERFSKDRPRMNDTLDVIKFLCKDLWSLVFGKNIDNLKTNHRGVYVLTDNVFRPLSRMSTEPGGQAVARALPFLWFPCGIVRGALAALGIDATVHADIHELPGAVFQIKTLPAKS